MRLVATLRLGLLVAALGVGAGGYWWLKERNRLPEGFASGPGRIEAEEVHVATTVAGRVAEVLVRAGDMVHAGQVVARLDAVEIEAGLARAEAAVRQAESAAAEARAQVAQREAALTLAEGDLDRVLSLFAKGNIPRDRVDQGLAARDAARAALTAARTRQLDAERLVEASRAEARRIRARRDELVLRAPRAGRVQDRLAEPGAVLPAGGRVATVLDLTEIAMTVFLSPAVAGRLRLGSEARIVLDAAPRYVIPAHISSISSISGKARFAPEGVETRSERENPMFRVKLRIAPELLAPYADRVKIGMSGEAYVRLDETVPWPPWLAVGLPPRPSGATSPAP